MSRPTSPEGRQIIPRNFPDKYQRLKRGAITAFINVLNPQPPEGYRYGGRSFNGAELFTDGDGRYFFPARINRPGEILYVREEWGVEHGPDGEAYYIYRAGYPTDIPAVWRPAAYMPLEAVRFFLQVESTELMRLQDVGAEGAKAAGVRGRGGESDLRRFWAAEARKGEPDFDGNPWVQVTRFHLIQKPEWVPEGRAERAEALDRRTKRYIVRYAETGEIAAQGTTADCAKAMGFRRSRGAHDLFTRIRNGKNKTYTLETIPGDKEEP